VHQEQSENDRPRTQDHVVRLCFASRNCTGRLLFGTRPRAPRRCFRGPSRARAARRRAILSQSAPGGRRSTAGSIAGLGRDTYRSTTILWAEFAKRTPAGPFRRARAIVGYAEFTIRQAKGPVRWLNPPAYPSTLGVT